MDHLSFDRRRFLGLTAGAVLLGADPQPDYRLVIAPVTFEVAPGHVVTTTGYSGSVPGPLIRAREGRPVTIEVVNRTRDDIVHWHGLHVPPELDGAMEEGSPMIMRGESRRFTFTAKPAGTRWYHSHAVAAKDLTRSLYTGQFGFFYVEPRDEPGRFDQEHFVALHQWEPSWIILQDLRRGPPADNGLEVGYKSASWNGRALGHGDPIRVRQGERVLFRLLNASATMDLSLALPGHRFTVLALDGNRVPFQTVDVLYLAPGERVDALVAMNNPGKWIFGATNNDMRMMGMGAVVEYGGATGDPVWTAPPVSPWDYTIFSTGAKVPQPDGVFNLLFEKIAGGRGGYNRWTINGKSWPDSDPLIVQRGRRYRIVMRNDSGDMHPIHLHRHTFEVTNWTGKPLSGLMKDVLAVPGRKTAEIDFVADNPGPALLHCHMQDHQDFGFMTIVKYAS